MKTNLTIVVIAGMLTLAMAHSSQAQQGFESSAGDKKSSTIDQQKTKDGKMYRPSQHTSVVVMMSEHGLEIFSPGARAELGQGEKLVTEPVEHERKIGDAVSDKKSYGGIRLIGWFF